MTDQMFLTISFFTKTFMSEQLKMLLKHRPVEIIDLELETIDGILFCPFNQTKIFM